MCKGADSTVYKLLRESDRQPQTSATNPTVYSKVQGFVDCAADEGLRTLFFAYKYIDEKEYSHWANKKEMAMLEIDNRDEKVANIDEQIEKELTLLGATAVEDKL